jgi:hypothetical protein
LAEPTLFVAIPLHNGWIHSQCAGGLLGCMTAFRDRIRVDTQGGSFLPRNRDILTAKFLDSGATHMLCVDSDIGWTPEHAHKLLDARKWYVSGVYAKKCPELDIPARLNGQRDGELYGAEYVPGGFQLMAREMVLSMWDHYIRAGLGYKAHGMQLCALWMPRFVPGASYSGEDVSFCERWRNMGGDIWIHPGVVVSHYGERAHLPAVDDSGVAILEGKCQPPREPG